MPAAARPPRTDPNAEAPRHGAGCRLNALAVELEPATIELIGLWLAGEGYEPNLGSEPDATAAPPALILVEMAFPRHAERERLRRLAERWPGVPVIVLSPTFFADVPSRGDTARQLGVAAVLATPLSRDGFVAAVRGVLRTAV